MKKRTKRAGLIFALSILGVGIDFAGGDLCLLTAFSLMGVATSATMLMLPSKNRLEQVNTKTRLLDLKETINRCDRQLKLLENYLDEKSYTQYAILARQLLPQLAEIGQEAKQLKDDMDLNIYKRISKKVEVTTTDIKVQLEALNMPTDSQPASMEEEKLMKLAPELMTIYRNIQIDHQTITEKIKTSNSHNKAELTALHEAEMARFHDILSGYLYIKESPKNYYKADERLASAKQAMETFDKDLDETIRQLNENDLQDFEISLRMMAQKNQTSPNDNY
ncbi:hypothetical protein [Streptococcus cuniculipharyngis]|uniref:5-bromo-4-chloroindolyl phosphate hydrolysis protein n=1 Tax=Streptococcus cuniculipharyngis TaxID=1562651 RepID=A0A5C5SCU2_9STRE|nr:hypothetical protein [Streptococcus cuniculipharyngis]TWS97397.1 hypothetical protein FRX57_05605 [Streptococcus cuniculipharyngis]